MLKYFHFGFMAKPFDLIPIDFLYIAQILDSSSEVSKQVHAFFFLLNLEFMRVFNSLMVNNYWNQEWAH